MTMRGRAPPSARLGMNSLYIRLPAALLKVAATNLVPSGAISTLDSGARPTGPGRLKPERSLMPPKGAGPLCRLAGLACVDGPLSLSSTTWPSVRVSAARASHARQAQHFPLSLRGRHRRAAFAAAVQWLRPVGRHV